MVQYTRSGWQCVNDLSIVFHNSHPHAVLAALRYENCRTGYRSNIFIKQEYKDIIRRSVRTTIDRATYHHRQRTELHESLELIHPELEHYCDQIDYWKGKNLEAIKLSNIIGYPYIPFKR